MKRILASVFVGFAAVASASLPSGPYMSYLGYNAGENATGGYTTFMGGYSGYNATDIQRGVLMGVRSGYGMSSAYRAFGLGYNVLSGSHALTNVTAINSTLFNNRTNLAGLSVIGQMIVTASGFAYTTNYIPGEYDYYVAEWGSDAAAGTSVNNPKQSIDGVAAAVGSSTNRVRIALLAGDYAYPACFVEQEHTRHFDVIGVHGRERTHFRMEKRPSTAAIWGRFNDTRYADYCYFEGITFHGLNRDVYFRVTGSHSYVGLACSRFKNCDFTDIAFTINSYRNPFTGSLFEDCRFYGIDTARTSAPSGVTFLGCEMYGCEIYGCNFGYNELFYTGAFCDSMLLDTSGIYSIAGNVGSYTMLFSCSTILLDGLRTFDTAPSLWRFENCIVGINDSDPTASLGRTTSNTQNSLFTSYADAMSYLGSDFKVASELSVFFCKGYGCSHDRKVRNWIGDNIQLRGECVLTDQGTNNCETVIRAENGILKVYQIVRTQSEEPPRSRPSNGLLSAQMQGATDDDGIKYNFRGFAVGLPEQE